MQFYIMTLFPDMVMDGLNTSIIGRAMDKGLLDIEAVNIRDYAFNKHNSVDDYPYGGGAGMLMQAEPVYQCYEAVKKKIETKALLSDPDTRKSPRVIYLSPQGKTFNQTMAEEFAQEEDLVFLCGHYEGIDQRVIDEIVDEEISIGDYVLTGGEIPAMVLIDSVSRYIEGVISSESTNEESFSNNLLEYPQYTRPEVFNGVQVPEILKSGHHENINKWRRAESLKNTYKKRPELLKDVELSYEDKKNLGIK